MWNNVVNQIHKSTASFQKAGKSPSSKEKTSFEATEAEALLQLVH